MSTEKYYQSIPSKEVYFKNMTPEQKEKANKHILTNSFTQLFFQNQEPTQYENNEENFVKSNNTIFAKYTNKL